MVSLDAVEEEIAVLLEERIDAERQVVQVGGRRDRLGKLSLFKRSQGRWDFDGNRDVRALVLMDERGDQVRVVDFDGKFDENVLVSQV